MYIVAIAWVYVAAMMGLTETSFIAGVLTFVFYGLAPLALFLWLMGTPARRRLKKKQEQLEEASSVVTSSVTERSKPDD